MSWQVTVMSFGTEEIAEVEAPTFGEAVAQGLDELGFSDNDEGSYTIQVSGVAA